MHIVVVGSEGFIGQALVRRLLSGASVMPGRAATAITRVDQRMTRADAASSGGGSSDSLGPTMRCIEGDICDRTVLAAAFEGGVDAVFHLASVPGGAAEQNFELGLKVNLQATIELLEALRISSGAPPKLVFASTIGVYGVPMPEVINEDTLPEPSLSYGAHKYIGEVLIHDYSRRGTIDGVALRIPGIVARPPSQGMLSIFLSDLIRELSAGRSVVCPVAADAPAWWMSRPCVVDNFLHALEVSADALRQRRTFLMPVLRLTIGEVVQGIAAIHGGEVLKRIRYEPNARLQAQFANYPPLRCPHAVAAGFRHDGDVATLVRRALATQ